MLLLDWQLTSLVPRPQVSFSNCRRVIGLLNGTVSSVPSAATPASHYQLMQLMMAAESTCGSCNTEVCNSGQYVGHRLIQVQQPLVHQAQNGAANYSPLYPTEQEGCIDCGAEALMVHHLPTTRDGEHDSCCTYQHSASLWVGRVPGEWLLLKRASAQSARCRNLSGSRPSCSWSCSNLSGGTRSEAGLWRGGCTSDYSFSGGAWFRPRLIVLVSAHAQKHDHHWRHTEDCGCLRCGSRGTRSSRGRCWCCSH